MFCMDCGTEIIEGAKFCINCGAEIMVGFGKKKGQKEIRDEGKVILQKTVSDARIDCKSINDSAPLKEEVIEDIFSHIFCIRGEFGKYVYITGKDRMSPEIMNNLKEHFMSGDSAEKPLLVFEYGGEKLKSGIVITNKRLVWDYERGLNEIFLTDIKYAAIGKSKLATVMHIVSINHGIYPKAYLTWMNNEERFVAKSKKFISAIHKVFGINMENQKIKDSFLIHACEGISVDKMYCEVGSPTIPQSSGKYQKAKRYFNIPDSDELFLIYDNTVLRNCKKGFALCTSGFYYCLGKSEYILWDKFASVKIAKSFGGFQVDGAEFVTSSSGDSLQLLTVLISIQESLIEL